MNFGAHFQTVQYTGYKHMDLYEWICTNDQKSLPRVARVEIM